MRSLIDLVERAEQNIKTQVISAVKQTDDDRLLQKVLGVLRTGNLDERVAAVLGKDADARKFLDIISEIIMRINAPLEQKDQFLEKFPQGILDVSKLLDGSQHSFQELVGAGFNTELFKILASRLTSQGVGPGEVALAIYSPDVKWSGRTVGGGDILVKDRPVEVKTSISAGGRWINARKANMDMRRIRTAIENGISKSQGTPVDPALIPARVNANKWVNELRPMIKPEYLDAVVKDMAEGLFSHVDTSRYQSALKSGDAATIIDTLLDTGYENYKKYSGFEGILLMDVPTESAQYFKDYPSMRGKIKINSPYLLAPESEAMPQVSLRSENAPTRRGRAQATGDEKPATPKPDLDQMTDQPKFTGPAARAARSKRQPRTGANVLGREKRR